MRQFEGVLMKSERCVASDDYSQYLAGGGCLLSIPVFIAFGFKYALKYAKEKEHEFAHQVEEVELEGDAAAQLEAGLSPKEALVRLVKKLERITAQYSATGARFSALELENEKKRLESVRQRLAQAGPDPECQALLEKAQRCLQQYSPQS